MAEIALVKRVKYACDVYKRLLEGGFDIDNAVLFLEGIPDADVAPVRHGRWIKENSRKKSYLWICSNCSKKAYYCGGDGKNAYQYCPNCGAKMDGERKENEDG